jgi:hypothetical protein
MEDKNMKKALLAVLAAGLVAGLVFAQTVDDFKIDLTEGGDGIIITGYTGAATKVVIPAEIEGIPVQVIRNGAFQNLNITEVVIPDTVTIENRDASTGHGAFRNCTRLTSVTMPNNLTEIGGGTFSGCSKLASITIPNSVTTIGSEAFSGCTSLASITIPNSVTTIGSEAFGGCSKLASITIPNSVTTIGNSAFRGCGSLASITIPNSVTTIGSEAFYNCGNLTSVIVEEGAKIKFLRETFLRRTFEDCKLDVKSQIALKKAGYTESF